MTAANVIFSPGLSLTARANEFDFPRRPWTVEQVTVTTTKATSAAAPAGTAVAFVCNGATPAAAAVGSTVTFATGWLLGPYEKAVLPCVAGETISIIEAV